MFLIVRVPQDKDAAVDEDPGVKLFHEPPDRRYLERVHNQDAADLAV